MGGSLSIPWQLLMKIPHLSRELTKDRVIPTAAFFVDGKRHLWIPHGDDLIDFPGEPVEAAYLGDRPERPTDQRFALLELIAQHTLAPPINRPYTALHSDFRAFTASLAKLRFFLAHGGTDGMLRRFALTELEYLIMVSRSVYDYLQEIVRFHWSKVMTDGKPPRRQLPDDSFRKVVCDGETPLTPEQIQEKYDLMPELAGWYADQIKFFLQLRALRDTVVHRGAEPASLLYVTQRGFALDRSESPLNAFYDWPVECELPNHLVPLRPLVCKIVRETIRSCDSFAELFRSTVGQLPVACAPGLGYYLRGYHDRELVELDEVIERSTW